MSTDDAKKRLELARQIERRSAKRGAFGAAFITAVLVVALGAVVDLDMVWLAGVVALGFAGLSVARPLRLHLDWTDRLGASLLAVGALAAIAAYLLTQFLARSLELGAPNTLSALATAVVIFAVCLPALVRLATRGVKVGPQERHGNA